VVARWTGELDMERLHAHLDNPAPDETDEPERLADARTQTLAP
jgi:aerobic C4-dicarboxylate transport protein